MWSTLDHLPPLLSLPSLLLVLVLLSSLTTVPFSRNVNCTVDNYDCTFRLATWKMSSCVRCSPGAPSAPPPLKSVFLEQNPVPSQGSETRLEHARNTLGSGVRSGRNEEKLLTIFNPHGAQARWETQTDLHAACAVPSCWMQVPTSIIVEPLTRCSFHQSVDCCGSRKGLRETHCGMASRN